MGFAGTGELDFGPESHCFSVLFWVRKKGVSASF
jgi:hypothetical protein